MQSLKILCFSCKKTDHMINACQMIHYVPNKVGVIKRYMFSEDQERNDSHKRYLKKLNAMSNLRKVQTDALTFSKSQNYIEDSRILHDSDCSGNDEENSSHSSIFEQTNENNKKQHKTRKSLVQNSAILRTLNFTLGKLDTIHNLKINEEEKANFHEEEIDGLTNLENRPEKFKNLRIETKVRIL